MQGRSSIETSNFQSLISSFLTSFVTEDEKGTPRPHKTTFTSDEIAALQKVVTTDLALEFKSIDAAVESFVARANPQMLRHCYPFARQYSDADVHALKAEYGARYQDFDLIRHQRSTWTLREIINAARSATPDCEQPAEWDTLERFSLQIDKVFDLAVIHQAEERQIWHSLPTLNEKEYLCVVSLIDTEMWIKKAVRTIQNELQKPQPATSIIVPQLMMMYQDFEEIYYSKQGLAVIGRPIKDAQPVEVKAQAPTPAQNIEAKHEATQPVVVVAQPSVATSPANHRPNPKTHRNTILRWCLYGLLGVAIALASVMTFGIATGIGIAAAFAALCPAATAATPAIVSLGVIVAVQMGVAGAALTSLVISAAQAIGRWIKSAWQALTTVEPASSVTTQTSQATARLSSGGSHAQMRRAGIVSVTAETKAAPQHQNINQRTSGAAPQKTATYICPIFNPFVIVKIPSDTTVGQTAKPR